MRHARSYAREKAIKGLYQIKINKNSVEDLTKINDELAIEMIRGIKENEEQINGLIKKYLKRWSITELNPVNLAILQVAIYEFLEKDLDNKIIISEALKFANEYSENKDKNFIHFVLDSVYKDLNV